MTLTSNSNSDTSDLILKIDSLNATSYQDRNRSPASSLVSATEALKLADQISYLKGRADALCNTGFYHLQLTEHEKSLEVLMKALEIHESIGDERGIANSKYNLAALQIRFGNFDMALAALQSCIVLREKYNDKAGLALCYFQMVYINEMFEHYGEALEIGQKALEIRRELDDRTGIAALLTQMAAIYRKKKEYDTSKTLLEEALKLRTAEDEVRGYFATVFQWVELNTEIGNIVEARKYSQIGRDLASKENEWFGVMRFDQQLGKLAMLENKPDEALVSYTKALEIAQEKKFKSITYELFQALADLYEKMGDYKISLEFHKKFHRLKEDVLSSQSGARLKSIQMMNQLEASKREAELQHLKHVDLKNAFHLIAEKNKEILDSIKYASRIQRALITQEVYIERSLEKIKGIGRSSGAV